MRLGGRRQRSAFVKGLPKDEGVKEGVFEKECGHIRKLLLFVNTVGFRESTENKYKCYFDLEEKY